MLVDAYGSPTIISDANGFSKMMGLPALTASSLKIVYPDGPPIANPYPTGWPVEISLDVEWAHAIAPKANLVRVVAPSGDADERTYALHDAVWHRLGEVISNSYGCPESCYGPATARAFNSVLRRAAAAGIAVNVSTGDSGDFGLGTPVGAASIPADPPFATGVGGTFLGVPSDIGPVETSWGTTETFIGDINGINVPPVPGGFVEGGGESADLEKPCWQTRLPGSHDPAVDPFEAAPWLALAPATEVLAGDQAGGVLGGDIHLRAPEQQFECGIWLVLPRCGRGRCRDRHGSSRPSRIPG